MVSLLPKVSDGRQVTTSWLPFPSVGRDAREVTITFDWNIESGMERVIIRRHICFLRGW